MGPIGKIAWMLAAMALSVTAADARHLSFAGRDWRVKVSGRAATGPGPNYFTGRNKAVFVDQDGALHLTIDKSYGEWRSTEVYLEQSLGYGTYRFEIAPGATHIPGNAVFGMFTYDDEPAENYREIDIELSQWGDGRSDNLACSVQPAELPGQQERFALPENTQGWIMQFTWAPGVYDCTVTDQASGKIVGRGHITGRVPTPGNEKTHINLWLFRGHPPLDGQRSEVVVRNFSFEPLP